MAKLFTLCSLMVCTVLAFVFLSAVSAVALETVTLQLKWTHAFQFAGYYAAQEKGYYRDAGLNVEFLEAQPETDVVMTVITGRAQYGIGTSSLLLSRAAGKPVVSLAVIFQHSPLVLVAAKQRPTQSIHDLLGKKIMIEPQSDELLAYLKQEGVAPESIAIKSHSFDIQDLLTGKVDAISAYSTNELFYLDKARFSYQIYTPRSSGIDFYGDNLFTSEQELKAHPERVEAFRSASLQGWRYAMQHPEEIADLIYTRYSKRDSPDFYLFEARQMEPLLRQDLVEVGYMSPGRWRHIADIYADQGLLPRDVSLDGMLYNVQPLQIGLKRLNIYLATALAFIAFISVIAFYIFRINRRLAALIAENVKTTTELIKRENLWRTIILTSPDGIAITSLDGVIHQASDKILTMFGYESTDEVIGRNIFEFIDPSWHAKAQFRISGILNGVDRGATDYLAVRKDGSKFYIESNAEILRDQDGHPRELFFVERDITNRKRIEAALKEKEAHYRLLIEEVSDIVWELDSNYHFTYISPADERLRGYRADEVIGHHVFELMTEEGIAIIKEKTRQKEIAEQDGTLINQLTFEVQQRCKDGSLIWTEILSSTERDHNGAILGFHGMTRNITERKQTEEALKEANHKLAALSITDGLTGIANRRHFDETLIREYARHARSHASLSLILLDIDHFKAFNDCYGHVKGDECLRLIAQIIASHTTRAADLAARYGGEEFACILPETDLRKAVNIAEKIRAGIQALAIPHQESKTAESVTASLGVISARYDVKKTIEEILVLVDEQLYRAKTSGRNQVAFDAAQDEHLTQTQGGLVQLFWEDAFCCGNELIDSQHQALFLIANKLFKAVLEKHPKEIIAAIVTQLLDDVAQHFHDEEQILETIGFPGLKDHAEVHAKLLRKGVELAQNFTNDTLEIGDLFKFLVYDTIKLHMLGADREYVPFIKAQTYESVRLSGDKKR